jgi:hypothetical protein
MVVVGALVLFGTGAATGAYVLYTGLHQRGAIPQPGTHASWVGTMKSFVASLTGGQ